MKRVRRAQLTDLDDVYRLHVAAFSGTMGVRLGEPYVRAVLQYFVLAPTAIFLVSEHDASLNGYVFGQPITDQRAMTRATWRAAARGVVRNPGLLLGANFRAELGRRALAMIPRASQAAKPRKPDDLSTGFLSPPIISLVGIGVDARTRGSGIAGSLISAYEEAAQSAGFRGVRLSVYKSNAAARRAYEKARWQPFRHPSNDEVLYYGKRLERAAEVESRAT